VVRELIHAGWHVEAEGKAFRRPGTTRVDVRTGIDWFELHGEVDYDGQTASLPQLLAAVRRGDTMVRLGDGTYGLLPEEWLERFAPLAGLGSKEEDHLRFRRNQASLLDALLAAQPEVGVDALFQRVRERMRTFTGVKTAAQPRASSDNCAITSAKASAGWSSSASSVSAAAWPTTWASARQRKCWPSWNRAAPRAAGPRSSWRPNPSCSTGVPNRSASRRNCASWSTPAWRATPPSSPGTTSS